MTDLTAAFLAWAADDKGRSANTVRRYKVVLAQLEDPAGASVEDVQRWWDSRLDKKPATRANELACLRSFYRWQTRFDHRDDDPTRRLDAPKVDNRHPHPISRTEMRTLLTACDEAGEPPLRRAICLGVYGGLRVSEAATLEWANVDVEHRRLRVRGKGSKERLAGLSPILLDELLPDVGGNVVTGTAKGYTGDALQRKVNRFMARNGVPRTFHSLRGRYVSQAIAKTGDIYAVAKAVGWASIETASAYAALSDEALDRIAAAAAE